MKTVPNSDWLVGAEDLIKRIERQEYNLERGYKLGWTSPTSETFSGRMAGYDPKGNFDVWPDFANEDAELRPMGFIAVE